MPEDDIYGSKGKYERFKATLPRLVRGPPDRSRVGGVAKYRCTNPANLAYFTALFHDFDTRDLSYIGRLRILQSLRFLCHATDKDLTVLERADIDGVMSAVHRTYASPKSTETFVCDLKCIWRRLFPETDDQGRPGETLTHLEQFERLNAFQSTS